MQGRPLLSERGNALGIRHVGRGGNHRAKTGSIMSETVPHMDFVISLLRRTAQTDGSNSPHWDPWPIGERSELARRYRAVSYGSQEERLPEIAVFFPEALALAQGPVENHVLVSPSSFSRRMFECRPMEDIIGVAVRVS